MQYGKSQEAIDGLTAEQSRVTQEAGTERPFTGEYNDDTQREARLRRCLRRCQAPVWAIAIGSLLRNGEENASTRVRVEKSTHRVQMSCWQSQG